MNAADVVPVVMDVELPAGMVGPEPVTFDVRCYLVPHGDGVLLIDTGIQADAQPIADGLSTMGAGWDDVSDVVLTHAHPDHFGGLSRVVSEAPRATIWGGGGDTYPTAARSAEDGTLIHGLRIVSTPGHTPGHLCLFDEGEGTLFTGDAIGSQAGTLTQGPAMFTADPERATHSLLRLAELRPRRMLFGHGDEIAHPADSLASFVTS